MDKKFQICLVICFHIFTTALAAGKIGCKDEFGEVIDWFYIYKLPNKFDGDSETASNSNFGYRYLYITPKSTPKWVLSKRLINDTQSMPGQTLAPAYIKDKDTIVLMYNDENPNGTTDGTRGHTKGVVVANDQSGFWLVHSVPKFPPPVEKKAYDYPKTGSVYGQSFLCMSFNGDQMGAVGKQLKFNEPHFYSSFVPENLHSVYPELVEALDMVTITKAPFYNVETLTSQNGGEFISFAKSGKFDKELYEDLVAPHYDSGDFYVETWRHGPGNIDSDCSKPAKVYNIEDIAFKGSKITFKTLRDHSKWMVSEEHSLICVGDINRQEHQKVRGGGTVCRKTKVSTAYKSLIKDVESCKNNKRSRNSSNDID